MLKGERVDLTPQTAWFGGTNIRAAIKEAPEHTRAWLALEVTRLVRDIDAKKTISSNDEIEFVCREIIADHPTIKLEEIRLAFDRIRSGKFKIYERLKAAEMLGALRDYEGGPRAEVMERHHYSQNHNVNALQFIDRQQVLKMLDETPGPKAGIGTTLRKELDKRLGPCQQHDESDS